MDFADSPQQASFRGEVRAFVQDRLPDHYQHAGRREMGEGWQADLKSEDTTARQAAADWARALSERHWVAPNWPPEYGGGGFGAWEWFIFEEELREAGAPIVGGQGVQPLGPTIIVHGTDEQKRKYLPSILSATGGWCQGYSEPGAGSDLASLQTRAIHDGDDYVINGQKIWTSNAHTADSMFILVRTDSEAPKHRGLSLLIIDDMKTPGLSVRPLPNMAWGHEFNETFFEDVRVPASNVVGAENRGWYVAMTLMDFDRMNNHASAITSTLREVAEYATTDRGREQARFESLPAIRGEFAERFIEAQVGELFGMLVASIQAEGRVPNYEVSVTKAFTNGAQQKAFRTATNVFGLYSTLWSDRERAPLEGAMTRGYVTSVSTTIAAGSSEIQKNVIATRGLGLPRA